MQMKAWTNCMTALVLAAFGVLMRWLQLGMAFEEETGLPIADTPLNSAVGLFLALSCALIWVISRKLPEENAPTEAEEAFAAPPKAITGLLIFCGLLVFTGSLLLYFTGSGVLMKTVAMLGILSSPALLMYPSLPKWGGLGVLLGTIPIVFFSFWLIVSYKEHAVNPVVWSYCVQILAIAANLLAAYFVAGYLFCRPRPRRAAFACCLAIVLCLTVLADDNIVALRLIFAGWGIGYLSLGWLLIRNFRVPESVEENVEESVEKTDPDTPET